jgi:acetyl esterase/lipase
MNQTLRRVSIGAATLLLLVVTGGGAPRLARGAEGDQGRYLDRVFTDVQLQSDIVYGQATDANGQAVALKLDLYQPVGDVARARPVVIWVHPGAFTSGDKAAERNAAYAIEFARRGWVAAAINFRIEGVERDSTDDLQASVRWFKAHVSDYRIQPDRIVVMGASSGAVSALHANFGSDDPGSSGNPEYPSTVAAAVSISGTVQDHTIIGPGEPPIAMIHSLDDTTIPYAEARATCEETRANGNVCEMFEYQHGEHKKLFVEQFVPITEQTSDFLCRIVLVPGSCPDLDFDGVGDGADACPTVGGGGSDGCPVPDDQDNDGVSDATDSCPALVGISANGCPNVQRSVSLRYSGTWNALKGTLAATERRCRSYRTVTLSMKIPGPDPVVTQVTTDGKGRYTIARPASAGQYYVVADSVTFPTVGNCLRARSPILRLH